MGLFLVWLVCLFLAPIIASSRGNSIGWAFFWALCAGPIGVVIALVLPRNESTLTDTALQSGEMKKCPYCAELIKREAIKCRFCGTDQPTQLVEKVEVIEIKKCPFCGNLVNRLAIPMQCPHCKADLDGVKKTNASNEND